MRNNKFRMSWQHCLFLLANLNWELYIKLNHFWKICQKLAILFYSFIEFKFKNILEIGLKNIIVLPTLPVTTFKLQNILYSEFLKALIFGNIFYLNKKKSIYKRRRKTKLERKGFFLERDFFYYLLSLFRTFSIDNLILLWKVCCNLLILWYLNFVIEYF